MKKQDLFTMTLVEGAFAMAQSILSDSEGYDEEIICKAESIMWYDGGASWSGGSSLYWDLLNGDLTEEEQEDWGTLESAEEIICKEYKDLLKLLYNGREEE